MLEGPTQGEILPLTLHELKKDEVLPLSGEELIFGED